MTSRLVAVALDCHDPEALAAFWCAALGYRVRERWSDAAGTGYVETGDGDGATRLPNSKPNGPPCSRSGPRPTHPTRTPRSAPAWPPPSPPPSPTSAPRRTAPTTSRPSPCGRRHSGSRVDVAQPPSPLPPLGQAILAEATAVLPWAQTTANHGVRASSVWTT